MNQVFKYDTIETHEARLSDDDPNIMLPTELIGICYTIEPWQGRLHYDKNFQDDLPGIENFLLDFLKVLTIMSLLFNL